MASTPGSTNGGTPFPGEPFTFPSFGNVGPPCIATLSLLGLTIRLVVWLFPTPVISNIPSASNAPSASNVSKPPTHQPHVDFFPSSSVKSPSFSPSSPSESSQASIQVDKKKKKHKEKKKTNLKRTKLPTTSDVRSKLPATVNRTGSVDEVEKIKTRNLKPKFPCNLCKGDHFLRDFPSLPKVLEMWSSTSSAPVGHASDTSSTSDVKVGKKKTTVKFPCMLCEGDHYSHLCPRMDEASYLLEKLQLPTGYRKISPNPLLVNGLVNPVPSPVSSVDQVVNLVSSSVEPLAKVVDPVPSSVDPTPPLRSAKVVNLVSSSVEPLTKVVDPVPSSVNPTLHLKSEPKVTDIVPSSVDPTPPLRSAKVVAPVTSSIDPTPPLKSVTQVVDPIPPSVDPTPPLRSAKVVAPVTPLVNPTPPLKSVTKVVDPIPPSVDPTPPLRSAKVVSLVKPPVNPTLKSKSEDVA
jgi:hypothetical protein